ncbi:hypothetical protein FQN54_004444 [Arachnomyces sp. PD_36]|nr:hypothetical protein FQN54_004444 [Arachnomyces sp. PD_36]
MHSVTALSTLAFATGALAGFDPSSINNVATYWGQNSAGGATTQSNLTTYCEDPNIDIIPMAFLNEVKKPGLNLGNVGDTCASFPSGLIHCPNVGEDIKTCQDKGKTIILSIGGATYTEGGFASEQEAIASAENIWSVFGPDAGDGVERPFDDAFVNGFDLDFEAPVTNMVAFANRMRELMNEAEGDFYITAAPQCPFPDQNNNEMLNGAVDFDIVWVQFYNNYCGLDAFAGGNSPGGYNFETWDNWAKNASSNPNVKVMTGAPAAPSAAGSGYVDASTLAEVIEYSKQFSSFGGVMMWDVSQAYANPGFLDTVKGALSSGFKRAMRRGMRLS